VKVSEIADVGGSVGEVVSDISESTSQKISGEAVPAISPGPTGSTSRFDGAIRCTPLAVDMEWAASVA
jgi:hypothetical protein